MSIGNTHHRKESQWLERGFEYFPSPENGDDEERIAFSFLYCSTAVDEWPAFRRHLETAELKSARQCDEIEKNAIDVFREMRGVMSEAIETDNLPRMREPKLLQRLMLAHAYLGLHANPAGLGGIPQLVLVRDASG
jgi:hypothetical protein